MCHVNDYEQEEMRDWRALGVDGCSYSRGVHFTHALFFSSGASSYHGLVMYQSFKSFAVVPFLHYV